jgi:6-phospho-beta-glucosidase
MARGCSSASASPGTSSSPETSTVRSTVRTFVLIQIRVGGQAARLLDETVPLACGCIGQETTGAGGFAKALRTVPVVLEIAERVRARRREDAGSWTSRIRSESSRARCSTRATEPWASATSRSVPARVRADARRRSRARRRRPGRSQPPHVGEGSVGRRSGCPPGPTRRARRRALRHGGRAASPTARELGAVPSYYLRYFYAHDTVLERAAHGGAAGETVAEIESELLEHLPRSAGGREACAAGASRRGVLQRGGDRARHIL